MQILPETRFLRAAARPADLLDPGPLEVAFAGRSNVGKSSAINALAGRRALARTSKTPGRTQTINFYALGDARLVDLPGYGYARAPRALRAQWATLVEAYLKGRATLVGVVLVMDARHPLTPLDAQLLAWLESFRVLALLSKADKLSRTEQAAVLTDVGGRLKRGGETQVRLFSSVTRQGVDECRGLLAEWLAPAAQAAKIKSPR